MEVKRKRTAREIKINSDLINNKNINVKIGAVENRNSPETIYIFISFWLKPCKRLSNKSQEFLRNELNIEFDGLYENEIKSILKDNKFFTSDNNNIYIKNIPENINYNKKKNFISIELHLHTLNIHSKQKFPLNNKKNTEIFNEAVMISNTIGNSKILLNKKGFEIYKKSVG